MENQSQSKPVIVLVEDDEILSRIVYEELADAGFHVVQAFDGESGVEMVRRFKPTLVLLDLILPKKMGHEVLAELKGDADTKDIPVVIMTMLGTPDQIEKSMRLGAEDHIIKSQYSVEAIVTRIKDMLEIRRAHKEGNKPEPTLGSNGRK